VQAIVISWQYKNLKGDVKRRCDIIFESFRKPENVDPLYSASLGPILDTYASCFVSIVQ
jgi:hypothetical protein